MSDMKMWIRANQELIAKAIGELTFEQVLKPVQVEESWELILSSGVRYSFTGWMSTWEHLRLNPVSIQRNGEAAISSAQFFIDSQAETKMDDIVLGNFLEEMNNTLFSDLKLITKRMNHPVDEIVNWDGEKIQTILNGHPKILLNKGRVGFSAQDLNEYTPESDKTFKLFWIAIKKTLLEGNLPTEKYLAESFSGHNPFTIPENYCLLPVHPWQWDRFIAIQFAGAIASGEIIALGQAGDDYRPQISLRTLSNVTHPQKLDIKLPLSILNTSCIRGLPAKSIAVGSKVSKVLKKICQEDPLLQKANTQILEEVAGVAYVQADFAKVKEAPYRYHEYLGAVWRQSAQSKTASNEVAIITASLFHQDQNNQSLIGAYIKKSGISKQEWLKRYFNAVVIPLYHLQLEYGVGMVAHGQNIILTLKDFAPTGMILKDFQGDLRLLKNLPPKGESYLAEVANDLTRLPANYLIHDLITGHFITVLRFISEVMSESDKFSEAEFYQILSTELEGYTKQRTIDPEQNLLAATFQRVLLNKVRFAIGYADTAARPLPMVGQELNNPLAPKGVAPQGAK
jgi:aerobactin synthase